MKNQGKGRGGGGEGAVDGTLLRPSGPLLEVGEGGYEGDVVAALWTAGGVAEVLGPLEMAQLKC